METLGRRGNPDEASRYEKDHRVEFGAVDNEVQAELEKSKILKRIHRMAEVDVQPGREKEKELAVMLTFITDEIAAQEAKPREIRNETYVAELHKLEDRLEELLKGIPVESLRQKSGFFQKAKKIFGK